MKTSIIPVVYGYQELQVSYQHNMILALMIAIFVQITFFCGLHFTEWLKQSKPPERTVKFTYDDILPPPIIPFEAVKVGAPIIPTKFSIGIPVPVPDGQVNPDITFAGPDDLAKIADRQWEKIGENNVVVDPGPVPKVDQEPLPETWTPFEKEPEIVMTSVPEYPALAIRIGLEGNVIVKVLIDKEGRVKKAIVAQTSDEIFSQPALDAAKKWVFTPARMNRQPVMVWIAIPFRFRLEK